MPPKEDSKLTTIALDRAEHERLYDFKSANRCRSYNEAVRLLLDTVGQRSLSPCAQ